MADNQLGDPSALRELAIMRAIHRLLVLLVEACGDLETAAILMAIKIGYLEGNPYDVSALAAACHIPRPTVHRKLKSFEGTTGRLQWREEGRRRIPIIAPDRPDLTSLLARKAAIIREACDVLSILDNYPVDLGVTDV